MSKLSNPWIDWLTASSLVLAVVAGIGVVGLLIAVALGVVTTGGPTVHPRVVAASFLGVIALLAFIFGMAKRWDRRHR